MRRSRLGRLRRAAAVVVAALAMSAPSASAAQWLAAPWPGGAEIRDIEPRTVTFPTSDPFVIGDIDRANGDTPRSARARLFLPPPRAARRPLPAVIMLHGAGGVIWNRELTYARQFAAMGVAALVVDAFGARRDLATGFVERLLNITESMLVADAYAGLAYLAGRGDIDRRRVALIGFSYGAMAAVFSAYRQVARAVAPSGPRFAAHVSLYGPCLARFVDPTTTGAPVLMLAGTQDSIVDRARCEEIAGDLRRGGSRVETRWYDGAWHQWDGAFAGPRPIGRSLAACRLRVDRDGEVWDLRTWLPMIGPLTRRLILGLCVSDEGYLIGRDDAVRARANADMGAFLGRALAVGSKP